MSKEEDMEYVEIITGVVLYRVIKWAVLKRRNKGGAE